MKKLTRRKFILGSLGAIGVLAITRCGNKPPASKEELLSEAEDADWAEIYEELSSNEARGQKNWDGKTVRMALRAKYVEDDCFQGCELFTNDYHLIYVYLVNKDELLELNQDWQVEVVGVLDLEHIPSLRNAYVIEASEPLVDSDSFILP